jgi:hypothetical protein
MAEWEVKLILLTLWLQVDENLTEVERKAAWEEYENEKKGLIQTNIGIENITNFGAMLQNMLPRSGDGRVMASPINPMAIQEQLRVMNPGQFPPPRPVPCFCAGRGYRYGGFLILLILVLTAFYQKSELYPQPLNKPTVIFVCVIIVKLHCKILLHYFKNIS